MSNISNWQMYIRNKKNKMSWMFPHMIIIRFIWHVIWYIQWLIFTLIVYIVVCLLQYTCIRYKHYNDDVSRPMHILNNYFITNCCVWMYIYMYVFWKYKYYWIWHFNNDNNYVSELWNMWVDHSKHHVITHFLYVSLWNMWVDHSKHHVITHFLCVS